MRWGALLLLLLIPSADAALTMESFEVPKAPVPEGGVGTINMTVALDCQDVLVRSVEGATIVVGITPDPQLQVSGPTQQEVGLADCTGRNVYRWTPSYDVSFRSDAIGAVAYDVVFRLALANTTFNPSPVAPIDERATLQLAYQGRLEVNLNGTIDGVGDGDGSISVWVDSVANAPTRLKFRIASAGEGTLTLPTTPTLGVPGTGATGAFLAFGFSAPPDWSGESVFEVEVTPFADADPKQEGATKVIDLVFSERGSTASVRDKGSPGFTVAFVVAALLLARRRA